ncbi:MAG: hypothetical protein FWG65_01635 [Turicibacter sp.]|nr:hypothetical protein [Turicibacter sp.]
MRTTLNFLLFWGFVVSAVLLTIGTANNLIMAINGTETLGMVVDVQSREITTFVRGIPQTRTRTDVHISYYADGENFIIVREMSLGDFNVGDSIILFYSRRNPTITSFNPMRDVAIMFLLASLSWYGAWFRRFRKSVEKRIGGQNAN